MYSSVVRRLGGLECVDAVVGNVVRCCRVNLSSDEKSFMFFFFFRFFPHCRGFLLTFCRIRVFMQNLGPSHNDKLAEGYKNTLTNTDTFMQRLYVIYIQAEVLWGVWFSVDFGSSYAACIRSSCCLVLLERGAYADSMCVYVCSVHNYVVALRGWLRWVYNSSFKGS